MHSFHILAVLIGGVIVLFSYFERSIEKGPMSEPMLAMIIGIIAGPGLPELAHPDQWGNSIHTLHVICEATLAMALMATALRLPTDYLQKHYKTLLVLLSLVLGLMALFAALSFWMFLSVSVLTALLLGAIIAPTDPVIATAIVSGPIAKKFLPARIRHTISMESGANDGLGMPFVMLPLLLLAESSENAWSDWFFKILLWENLGAIVIGAGIGLVTGRLITYVNKKDELTSKAFLSFSVALSFLMLAGLELIHTNGVVGVFACGLGLNHVMDDKHELKAERVQDMIERLFTIPIFLIFGMLVPWQNWLDQGWLAIVVPIVILIVRRIPAIFIAKKGLKSFSHPQDLWFAGWFGPVGVAALYYAIIAYKEFEDPIYWTWPTLIIFSSTLVHGITSGPLIKWYSKSMKNNKN